MIRNENEVDFENALLSKVSDLVSNPNHIILTGKELKEKLGVSSKTLQRWRDKGVISYSKVGGTIFYKWSDVLAMFEDYRVDSFSHSNN